MLTSTRRWRVPGFRVAFTYQWPDSPSGSATVWHACPLTVAWTVTRPRDGSWFPAFSGSRRMVDPSMAYVVASKRTAGTALAGLMASILSSVEDTTTWAAVSLHLDERLPLVIQLVTLCHRRSPGARAQSRR